MSGNWIRAPRAERKPRWKFHVGLVGALALFTGTMVAINWIGERMPSDTTVGPTPCDVTIAGQCARQLAPTTTRVTTTTKAPTTTVAPKVQYGPERPCTPGGTDILVITGGKSYCVIRTVTSGQLAWALTQLAN